MFFSIVVPVYNTQKYLEACIRSIIPQIVDFKEGAELILVDDGSKDRSGEICDRYHRMYPDFIHVYHKENEGPFVTRRFGFCRAQGEYILTCDSDDLCLDTQISDLKKVINETHADIVFFNIYMLKKNTKKRVLFENIFGNRLLTFVDKKDVLIDYITSYRTISMCCKAFRKECLDLEYDYSQYGRMDHGDDTIQSAEIYTHARSFVYYNKPLYYYRMGTGMTRKFQEDFYCQHKKTCQCIEKYIRQWDLSNIDCLMAVRVFWIVGRSITQSRLNGQMTFEERKMYLKIIREDPMVLKYEELYHEIRLQLQTSHRVFCSLFLAGHYKMIDCLLKMRNLVD